jgi:cytochrome c
VRLLAALALLAAPAAAQDAGRRAFVQCQACHSLKPGEHKTGPSLAGIVGRKAGAQPGYGYSPALAKSGLVWDSATLDRFLARPVALVPGTKMVFAGIADPARRQQVIAYLGDERKQGEPK